MEEEDEDEEEDDDDEDQEEDENELELVPEEDEEDENYWELWVVCVSTEDKCEFNVTRNLFCFFTID